MTKPTKKKPKREPRYFSNIASWVNELRKMGKSIEDSEKRLVFLDSANILISSLIKMDKDYTIVPKPQKITQTRKSPQK